MGKNRGTQSSDDKNGADYGAADISAAAPDKVGTFDSLRFINFRWLLGGTVLSNAAQWIQQVTLSWLVYNLTGSGTMLGTINLVRSGSSLGMIPVAGILIDRLDRRKLILFENAWLFTITITLSILILTGHSNMMFLFIFAILGGLVGTIDQSLRQVLIFDLVPRRVTPNAVALVQTGWSLMRSFGPGIGGFLILWFGPGGNFLVQASAYALVAITIMQIKFPARTTNIVHSSPLENIREGIRYVSRQHVTRTFMFLGFVLPIFIIPIFSILPPIYAVEVFGDESGKVLGFLMASVGVGGIGGGFVLASLDKVEHRGMIQVAALFLLSVTLVLFAFSTHLLLSLLLLAIAGFFELIFLTNNQTLLQLSIPDNLRGRVTSIVNLNAALSPLGGLIAGAGSDLMGGPKIITIVLAGIGAVIAVLAFLFSSTIRNYRISQAISQDSSRMTVG